MSSAAASSANVDFHSLPDEIAQGITDLQSSTPVGNYYFLFLFLCIHRLFHCYHLVFAILFLFKFYAWMVFQQSNKSLEINNHP